MVVNKKICRDLFVFGILYHIFCLFYLNVFYSYYYSRRKGDTMSVMIQTPGFVLCFRHTNFLYGFRIGSVEHEHRYIFIYTGYIYSVRHGKVVIIC